MPPRFAWPNGWAIPDIRAELLYRSREAIPEPDHPNHQFAIDVLTRAVDEAIYRTHHQLNQEA